MNTHRIFDGKSDAMPLRWFVSMNMFFGWLEWQFALRWVHWCVCGCSLLLVVTDIALSLSQIQQISKRMDAEIRHVMNALA